MALCLLVGEPRLPISSSSSLGQRVLFLFCSFPYTKHRNADRITCAATARVRGTSAAAAFTGAQHLVTAGASADGRIPPVASKRL